jgi:hypothetical protein
VDWFRQNQKLLTEEDEQKHSVSRELTQLKEKAKKLEEENKKTKDLEKKCKLLEETIKAKNPNNIAMLIQASKEKGPSDAETVSLKEKVKSLQVQLEEKDSEFEKK